MSTNGSTATDLSEIAVAAAAVRSLGACFESQNLSTTKYARVSAAAQTANAAIQGIRRFGGARTKGGRPGGGAVALAGDPNKWRRTASVSFASAACVPSGPTSTHCDSLKKYSSAGVSGVASVLSAMIGCCLDDARSISLPTWGDVIALSDRTSTSTLVPLIARTMPSAYSDPGITFRGAIQHFSP